MADIDPSSVPLPPILDPVLSYLSSVLPPPVYSALLTLLSHSLALITALYSLTATLFQSRPWEWDAQTIIPPLISVLAAYLAILSLYRTTSWMFRTSVWFMKWGSIIAALVAGAGWVAGNAGGAGVGGQGGGGGGMMNFLGGLVLDALNGQGQNAAGGTRSRPRTRSQTRSRPKPWDSFQQHRDWQYQENNDNANQGTPLVQEIIEGVVGVAERGGWLNAAKRAYDGFQNAGADRNSDDETGRRTQPARKAKTKAKNAGRDPR